MTDKQRVLILFGGRSAEHEISLLSARFVVEALDTERFEPILVAIDKAGRWRLESRDELLSAGVGASAIALRSGLPEVSLPPRPAAEGAVALTSTAGERLQVDVVFPVLHGPLGEDGTVQGLLELAGIPYVGSGVLGSAVGMDKDVMKRLLAQAGLPVLPYVTVRQAAYARRASAIRAEVLRALQLPVFVKPANLGSSVGVSRVRRGEELEAAIDRAFELDSKVVIEQGLDHPREIECAVLGGDVPFSSVPGEIVVTHPDGFYSYAAKYLDDGGAETRIPAQLTDEEAARARELSLRTFEALEGQGMARVDLFLDAERSLWVNEINTIPGFTRVSMYPKLMQASGVSPRELLTRLIDDALQRGAMKRAKKTSLHE